MIHPLTRDGKARRHLCGRASEADTKCRGCKVHREPRGRWDQGARRCKGPFRQGCQQNLCDASTCCTANDRSSSTC